MLSLYPSTLTAKDVTVPCVTTEQEKTKSQTLGPYQIQNQTLFNLWRSDFERLGLTNRSEFTSGDSKFQVYAIIDDLIEPTVQLRASILQ